MFKKKIHLQKREYAMIFTCIGLLLGFPIYGIIENLPSNVSYPFSFLIFPAMILVGYGWFMPLIMLIALDMNLGGGYESLNISSPLELYRLLPFLQPIITVAIIIKLSTGIPTWRTILYAHIIASGIGVYAFFGGLSNILSLS